MNAIFASLVLLQMAAPRMESAEDVLVPYHARSCVRYQPRYWASTLQSQAETYDYRRQFNYPWQMRPTAVRATFLPSMENHAAELPPARPQPELIPTREPNSK